MSIKIDSLASEVTKALEEYSKETTQALKVATENAAKECAKEVKANAIAKFGSGPYANDWASKKTYESNENIRYTVYNRKHYMLAHLLEFGHAKWLWGKKTGGTVSGRAHIRPAEESMERKFESEVKMRLSR